MIYSSTEHRVVSADRNLVDRSGAKAERGNNARRGTLPFPPLFQLPLTRQYTSIVRFTPMLHTSPVQAPPILYLLPRGEHRFCLILVTPLRPSILFLVPYRRVLFPSCR